MNRAKADVFCCDAVDWTHRGSPFSLILTDPPYSRAGSTHTSTTTATRGKTLERVFSDQMWIGWIVPRLQRALAACAPDACAFIFCDWRTIGALERAVIEAGCGWNLSQVAVWDRESMGLGSPLRAGFELIAFARGPKFKWEGRRDIINMFRCRWPCGAHEHHGSEKPVDLLREIVREFGGAGPVLDPFCGSGSSLVACKAEGIASVGLEIDPAVARVAAERAGVRTSIMAPTVVRRDPGGQLWLMNRRAKGWGEFGYPHDNEAELLLRWRVRLGPWTEDEHGPYCAAYPEAA